MNPKLVEEVAVVISRADDANIPDGISDACKHPEVSDWSWFLAQAAIRVCMARAAEIAAGRYLRLPNDLNYEHEAGQVIAAAIKREGGLT